MIEADVITGHLIDEPEVKGQKTDRIPIMGHPPAITSDLSLQELLDVWNQTDKLLKLDFKSTEAFTLALPIMEKAFRVSDFLLFSSRQNAMHQEYPTHDLWAECSPRKYSNQSVTIL